MKVTENACVPIESFLLLLNVLVWDAWAKPERGVMKGNLNWLGDYAECLAIHSTYNSSIHNSSYGFDAHYCTGQIPYSINTGTAVSDQDVYNTSNFLFKVWMTRLIFD